MLTGNCLDASLAGLARVTHATRGYPAPIWLIMYPAGGKSGAETFGAETMAKVRVMYWKEIPVQVQAEDESGRVSKQLDDRFQQGVDAISMFDGSSGTDDYLDAWEWGAQEEAAGSADVAVSALADRFNNGFPQDFVARVRDLHRSGERNPTPGAIDEWCER